jgi:predicted permease
MFRVLQIWFALYTAALFIVLQAGLLQLHDPDYLWLFSALTGFAYGNLFALLPIVTLERFGLKRFSAVSLVYCIQNAISVTMCSRDLGVSRTGELSRLLRRSAAI